MLEEERKDLMHQLDKEIKLSDELSGEAADNEECGTSARAYISNRSEKRRQHM